MVLDEEQKQQQQRMQQQRRQQQHQQHQRRHAVVQVHAPVKPRAAGRCRLRPYRSRPQRGAAAVSSSDQQRGPTEACPVFSCPVAFRQGCCWCWCWCCCCCRASWRMGMLFFFGLPSMRRLRAGVNERGGATQHPRGRSVGARPPPPWAQLQRRTLYGTAVQLVPRTILEL